LAGAAGAGVGEDMVGPPNIMVLFFGAAGGSAGAPNIIVLLPGFCGAGAGGGAAVGAFAVKTCAQRVH
jgi:hypothetical protein